MPKAEGQIITFYSYKGGTGRSMALANVACYLARSASVLAIDWDLDAPGLTQYFRSIVDPDEFQKKQGVLEFFEAWQDRQTTDFSPETYEEVFHSSLKNHTIPTTLLNLKFIPAGQHTSTYAKRLLSFRWDLLHSRFPGLLSAFANYLAHNFDYVLIDSRSGFSDVAGICTALLPEKLVAVFTPNRQNLEGLSNVLRRAIEYRKQSSDIRPLTIFPLASRVEASEPRLFEQWRFSLVDLGGGVFGYQNMFEKLFKDTYALATCDLTSYFDELQIQHVPRYSYGEDIALLVERSERLSLSRSYSEFAHILVTLNAPWEAERALGQFRSASRTESETVDREWFTAHRKKARGGLAQNGFTGYAEIRASLLTSRPNANQAQLLDATRKALIHAFGWPIGVMLESRADARPRPVRDGILAEVSPKQLSTGSSYDYWTWRRNGDFYLLQSLFEDERTEKKGARLFFETRISRITESLLYCSRVYRLLGVPGEARLRFTARWGGLKGRKLASAGQLRFLEPRDTVEDVIHSSETVALDRIRSEIVEVVKEILSPLFIVFDFLQLSDDIYKEIVETFVKTVGNEMPPGLGFRVDIEQLRLEVEPLGTQWASRVYDLKNHQTVSQTTSPDEQAAKLEAAGFAYLFLGRSKLETNPESIARTLPWQPYRPIW